MTQVEGHTVKQAAQESGACFKFWLCTLPTGRKCAAFPSEPQALGHLMVLLELGGDTLGNHSACAVNTRSAHRDEGSAQKATALSSHHWGQTQRTRTSILRPEEERRSSLGDREDEGRPCAGRNYNENYNWHLLST